MKITVFQLNYIMPKAKNSEKWIEPLNMTMAEYEINNKNRISAFLAQIAHESSELNLLAENLNYTAERLMQVFPKYFKTLEQAQAYERNPVKIANYIYANRIGNGDRLSGDGWKYKGRGLIQITGKFNYQKMGELLKHPLLSEPELLEETYFASRSAACFWHKKGLNEIADVTTAKNFVEITMLINGGKLGIAERINYWERAKKIL
ncbi:MAG: glycoside hydrolase family 19 protein [Desulfobacterales bacterium]|nr:glycoside hydrolase family 19 protein [Desulfobacterales bacterium]